MKFVRLRSSLLKVICTVIAFVTFIFCFVGNGFNTVTFENKQFYNKITKEHENFRTLLVVEPPTTLPYKSPLTSKSNQQLLSCHEILRLLSKAKTNKSTIHR